MLGDTAYILSIVFSLLGLFFLSLCAKDYWLHGRQVTAKHRTWISIAIIFLATSVALYYFE